MFFFSFFLFFYICDSFFFGFLLSRRIEWHVTRPFISEKCVQPKNTEVMFCSIEPSEQRKYKAQRRKELAEHKNEPLQRGTNLACSLMFLYTCTTARPITDPRSSDAGLLSICGFLQRRQDVSGLVYTNAGKW